MFVYANQVSDYTFGVGILISLYIVVFSYLKMRGEDTADCLTVAGFMTSIAAVLIFMIDLINSKHLIITFLMTVLPAIWSYWSKGE